MMSLKADEENSYSSLEDDEMTTDDSIATTLPHPGKRVWTRHMDRSSTSTRRHKNSICLPFK
jgi:hypothetical protein